MKEDKLQIRELAKKIDVSEGDYKNVHGLLLSIREFYIKPFYYLELPKVREALEGHDDIISTRLIGESSLCVIRTTLSQEDLDKFIKTIATGEFSVCPFIQLEY